MDESGKPPSQGVLPSPPLPPALPEVESPPREDLVEGVPSPEAIIEEGESAQEIVGQQPGVDELWRRDNHLAHSEVVRSDLG
jgi:hypothetical protein